MNSLDKDPPELGPVSAYLKLAEKVRRLRPHQLAERAGIDRAIISKLEAGIRKPTLSQLIRLARATSLPLQWFLSGTSAPGNELSDTAIELEALGVSDLSVANARVPGAFRPAEQIVALVLAPLHVAPRVVEAIPAVLAWNRWVPILVQAYCDSTSPYAFRRAAWLADVVLTIHGGTGFPGGVADPLALDSIRGILAKDLLAANIKDGPRGHGDVRFEPDDLGFPRDPAKLPPVSKRWGITYAATLDTFRDRALQLITHDSLGRFPERPRGGR